MEESPSKKNGRWLYVFGLTYLMLLWSCGLNNNQWLKFAGLAFHTDAGTYPSHLPPVPLFKARKPKCPFSSHNTTIAIPL